MDEETQNQNNSHILIVEDDIDQMGLLVDFAQTEIKRIIDNENTSDEQKQKARNIKIITATNIRSLLKAVQMHKNVLLAVLDCNLPDTRGGAPHDQFIKSNHKLTGQHRAVDIVSRGLPSTPITMISSLNRFQRIVNQYYTNTHNISINFIRKKDAPIIQNNIGLYLRQHLK